MARAMSGADEAFIQVSVMKATSGAVESRRSHSSMACLWTERVLMRMHLRWLLERGLVDGLQSRWKTLGLILTLAGGRGRPPKYRRQNTAARSKDRRGNSEFPAGLAGDCEKAARQPSGKPPSTRIPAPNGAGGVERVRRVQLHPSRFSVSAMQTLKILVGPC
ncbi:hypothetical protein NDU88_004314 [Pleurodeles waltl]|uniref:Uncharacterized protein n=1 Tax=Pleurodeles waltl TaxID=8319 RepID=A0AAV7SIK3_PLEWA|nr:hypothetical protein NDU88_004314 [Pleurodeles waltl]